MLSETEIVRWKMIAPSLLTLNYLDKAVVYGQGDRLESLFWLLRGIVKLSHITEGGVQLTIDVTGPGGVFGSTLAEHLSDHTATSAGVGGVIESDPLCNLDYRLAYCGCVGSCLARP
jgi:CRP-like cAMP-binding protein